MKAKEIQIGHVYAAKVSGLIVPVKVLAIEYTQVVRGRWGIRDYTKAAYRCRSLKTGREITVRSPMRFRYELNEESIAARKRVGETIDKILGKQL